MSERITSQEYYLICLHEAGHSVISLHLGVEIGITTVRSTKSYTGMSERYHRDSLVPPMPTLRVLISMAGQIAEQEFRDEGEVGGWASDNDDILSNLRWIRSQLEMKNWIFERAVKRDFGGLDSDYMDMWRRAESRARDLVSQYWEDILAVADILQERGQMSSNSVKRAIGMPARRLKDTDDLH